MITKKSMTALIAVMLLLLMTMVASGTMFYWFNGIQASAQEKSLAYERATLTQIVTSADLALKPDYSSEEEQVSLNLSDLSVTITNEGKVPLEFTEGTLNFDLERPDGEVICSVNVTYGDACVEWSYYMLVATRPDPLNIPADAGLPSSIWLFEATNLTNVTAPYSSSATAFSNYSINVDEANNIYAATEEVCSNCGSPEGWIMWSEYGKSWEYSPTVGNGFYQIMDLEEYNGTLYAAAYDSWNKVGVVLNSSNAVDWSEVATFDKVRKALVLEAYNNKLYVGMGDKTNNGSIYSSADMLSFTLETISTDTTPSAILAMQEYNGHLYAGTGQLFTGPTQTSSNGGPGYLLVRANNNNTWVLNQTGIITETTNITDFLVMNNTLYASTYNESLAAGRVFNYTGGEWDEHSAADGLGIGFLSLASWRDVELFAGAGSIIGGGSFYMYAPELPVYPWTPIMGVGQDWFTASEGFKKCTRKDFKCISGCREKIQPTDRRTLKFSLEETECDVSTDGSGTDYIGKLHAGRDFSIVFPFSKGPRDYDIGSNDV